MFYGNEDIHPHSISVVETGYILSLGYKRTLYYLNLNHTPLLQLLLNNQIH